MPPTLGGILLGVFILLPAYELVFYVDSGIRQATGASPWAYIRQNWMEALTFRQPFKLIFYALLGGSMGGILSHLAFKAAQRNLLIMQLREELERDLDTIIARGESETLEFKSSFRYDIHQQQVNKALEGVIMKTLAGMMNSEGGTLLIGVDDHGQVLGLAHDYQTLKRKDRDGFEQLLNNTIADKLGTPACEWVKVFFHVQQGQEVCRIRVLPAPQPVYAKEGQDSKFYLRTGSGTRALTLQEAIEFIQQKWKR
jgi:hypothetical protein